MVTPELPKSKGHADEGLVAQGRVREVDRIGHSDADAAADLGWRRVHCSITDARRLVTGACVRWYPVVQELHRFFVVLLGRHLMTMGWVVPRCTKLFGPMLLTSRRVGLSERCVTLLDCLVVLPCGRLLGIGCLLLGSMWGLGLSPLDILEKFTHFLGRLHWPRDVGDLGVGGVSYLELLILCERWAGERLVLEKALLVGRRAVRAGRPISVSAVPFGQGIEIWRCMLWFLTGLPGRLARFLPCGIGVDLCRLRHVGWEKCGHGLTSRRRETSDPDFLDSPLEVFGYPVGSGRLLLAGELPLRYCTSQFALRKPGWSLPEVGCVQGILTPGGGRGEKVGLVSIAVIGDAGISSK